MTDVLPGPGVQDQNVVVGRINPCRMVQLTEHSDPRGKLTVVQPESEIDFEIKRAFYVHGVPDGTDRGGHGHKRIHQLIVAVHGAFTVTVDDGFNRRAYLLDDPSRGLYVGPMVWGDMTGYAPGTVGLWLVNEPYDPDEYYQHYDEFRADARRLAA
ncbi:sugar 3,4-ketoisomerase [Actinophytocola xinjiangensis]|nr:FdtA/QdtA family cupin domain-containing protein [Actinophytocola xinjiangensis]